MIALRNSSEERTERAAANRLRDLRNRVARPEVEETLASTPTLATVLYVTSAILARPRNIDHYIDYFGGPVIQQR